MKPAPADIAARPARHAAGDQGTRAATPAVAKILREIYSGEPARLQPLALTLRLVAWQAWRRLLRRPMTFKTITGSRLVLLPGASDSLSGFWYSRIPDFEELIFALHLLRPEDSFVDVGANQGGWSLTVAGMGARVTAFEPVPVTFRRLLANIAANSPEIGQRIKAMPFGLGEFAGKARFTAGLDAGNHLIGDQGTELGESVLVEMGRMDDFLASESPVLIKIDVEGQELAVLRGARAVLNKPSMAAVIVETFRPANGGKPQLIALESLLRERGFSPVAYDPRKRELRPLVGPFEGAQNTIYVRDHSAVMIRLKQAMPVRALGTAF